ncbi:hypothetical protein Tsubulata_034039 [Turnera subulata]|uniref:Protein kinase domain-containing protein n=1 Tax=Turnera subulata TaxID=218843 RepID=A0A9Q0FHE0_9ROSI|nr:hypothetical protein Tsubulata_034039 [Turnera subulata]
MERNGEEVVVDDIAGNAELRGKGCDVPMKMEGQNVLASPLMCASVTGTDWAETSANDFVDNKGRTEENGPSTRHVSSFAGGEPGRGIPWSTGDNGNAVKELTAGNYRTPHLALVSSQESKWQHIYQPQTEFRSKISHGGYVSEDKDTILSRAGERLMKMGSDMWDLKPFSAKGVDRGTREIPAVSKARDKVSGYPLPDRDATVKTLSTPSFSQPLVKKAKGKGVALKRQEDMTESDDSVGGHVNGKLGSARKVSSGVVVRSTANGDQLSCEWGHRSGPEPLNHGISLREWLKPENGRRDKVERLHIFRQIVELVDSAHTRGVVFQDLRPSCLNLAPSNKIVYTGSFAKKDAEAGFQRDSSKKRPLEQEGEAYRRSSLKQQKQRVDAKFQRHDSRVTDPQGYADSQCQENCNNQIPCMNTREGSICFTSQLERKWYRSPEQWVEGGSSFSSNIYSLGVLLFELLSAFESLAVHSAVMLDLHDRILPPTFLSENPREAGFCLWLLHPEPSSRPTAREILQSELIGRCETMQTGGNESQIPDNDDTESGLLLHFLNSLKEQKQKYASKLVQTIEGLEEDIKEVEKRHSLKASEVSSQSKENFNDEGEQSLHLGTSSVATSSSFSGSSLKEVRFLRNIKQIEEAYFSTRSQVQHSSSAVRSDKDLIKNQIRLRPVQKGSLNSNMNDGTLDPLGDFFEGLCKFARYDKLEVCGSLRSGDLVSTTNVLCSLGFDRDEDYIAAAGVSKKIKVFEFDALMNDSLDIHYPVVEMSNKSKLSCVCWNNYIKNYLASADYDGVVKIWDAGTGQGFSQYHEHSKRAWSVDFSVADPLMFVSGSDDCSVKLWSINERNSLGTIWNPANVCCVQFSATSTYLLAFGSADYKVYCYDLRHTRTPWCTLGGHAKAVSYVKFLDSETVVSASTDNTLKLWDLNKTSSTGLSSSACNMTFRGHSNEKVYCYYKSLPVPITSHKFGCIDPVSGNEISDDNGQFVSSVCWRRKSNMVVAANSTGNIEALRMV